METRKPAGGSLQVIGQRLRQTLRRFLLLLDGGMLRGNTLFFETNTSKFPLMLQLGLPQPPLLGFKAECMGLLLLDGAPLATFLFLPCPPFLLSCVPRGPLPHCLMLMLALARNLPPPCQPLQIDGNRAENVGASNCLIGDEGNEPNEEEPEGERKDVCVEWVRKIREKIADEP